MPSQSLLNKFLSMQEAIAEYVREAYLSPSKASLLYLLRCRDEIMRQGRREPDPHPHDTRPVYDQMIAAGTARKLC